MSSRNEEEQQFTWYPYTDMGNAERLVDCHGKDLKYCSSKGNWYIWDGKIWTPDGTGLVKRNAMASIRSMQDEVPFVQNPNAHASWARKSESAGAIEAMVKLAKVADGLSVSETDFDKDPYLLNVQNGVLDMYDGVLRPSRRSDLHTKICSVPYLPNERCPKWEAFLLDIFSGDHDLVAYIQRFMGYCLTGLTREHVLHLFHGNLGRNGKGTVRNVIAEILGSRQWSTSYAYEAPISTFLESKSTNPGAPREDIMGLMGSRFVTASEPNANAHLDNSVVKSLTGEDPQTASRKNERQVTFKPIAKYLILTNHRPRSRSLDPALMARLRMVPFLKSYVGKEDKSLPDMLRAEYAGILAWTVRGLWDYGAMDGLCPPQSVLAATEDYATELDVIGQWLADTSAVILRPDAWTPLPALWESFETWCAETGKFAGYLSTFGTALTERGFKSRKNGKGDKRGRVGISIVS